MRTLLIDGDAVARRGPRFRDLTGQRFGRLVVAGFAGVKTGKCRWRCLCDCGGETVTSTGGLSSGDAKSCGCSQREVVGRLNRKHGRSSLPEFRVWLYMLRRCRDPKHPSHANYGGRGIVVCERWTQSFDAFLADVGPRPSTAHTLDRIDNDLGYQPGNVRWATRREQANNRRTNALVTVGERTLTLAEWARANDILPATIRDRLRRGWPGDRAVSVPTIATRRPS